MLVEPKDVVVSEKDKLIYYHTVLNNPYIPYSPYSKQALGLILASKDTKEVNSLLAGGSAYGGKTVLGSMLAVQFLQEPSYRCLVTRRNYAELLDVSSIWDNLSDWCCDEDLPPHLKCVAVKSPSPRIVAPNGATIYFKAFDHTDKKQKFKSASYNRIINDEASELPLGILPFQYRSLRTTEHIPLSVINLSNPSGESTEYLVENFVKGDKPYINIGWESNPFIDKEAYEQTLSQLDYIDQQYQRFGNWFYKANVGDLIDRKDMVSQLVDFQLDHHTQFSLISIDLAGKGKDKFAVCRYDLLPNGLEMIVDFSQTASANAEDMLINFVSKHNHTNFAPTTSVVVIEQEGGGSPLYAQRYFQELLQEFNIPVILKTPKGSKYQRARPLMRRIKNGNVKINKECGCIEDFIDESVSLDPLGKGRSPNLVDSCSLAHNYLHENVLHTGTNIKIGAKIGK